MSTYSIIINGTATTPKPTSMAADDSNKIKGFWLLDQLKFLNFRANNGNSLIRAMGISTIKTVKKFWFVNILVKKCSGW